MEKIYLINGEPLTVNEACEKYNISLSTFYRRIKDPNGFDLKVREKKKLPEPLKQYTKKELHEYPINLLLDLLDNSHEYNYEFNKVKANFTENLEYMFDDNYNMFDDRTLYVITAIYKRKMKIVQIANELDISKQRVEQIKECALDILRKPYFADYYLLGKEFVEKKETYYRFREKQLMHELGLLEKNVNNETFLAPDINLKVKISIKRLNLDVKIEKVLLDNGITTINELTNITGEELEQMNNIGPKMITKIFTALENFKKQVLNYE